MEMSLLVCVVLGAIAYLVGSIPTGAWFAKRFFGINIQEHGSGNIGASNIARVLGKVFFIPIFLIDASKAFFVLFVGSRIVAPEQYHVFVYSAAALLLIGNAHSIFLRLRGGKGVATLVGIMLYVMPSFVGLFVLAWGLLLLATRQPFMASLGAMIFAASISGMKDVQQLPFLLCCVLWLVYAHRANIASTIFEKLS